MGLEIIQYLRLAIDGFVARFIDFHPEMLLPDFKHCTLFNTGFLNKPRKLVLLYVLSVDLQKPSGRQRSLFPSYEWEKHKSGVMICPQPEAG